MFEKHFKKNIINIYLPSVCVDNSEQCRLATVALNNINFSHGQKYSMNLFVPDNDRYNQLSCFGVFSLYHMFSLTPGHWVMGVDIQSVDIMQEMSHLNTFLYLYNLDFGLAYTEVRGEDFFDKLRSFQGPIYCRSPYHSDLLKSKDIVNVQASHLYNFREEELLEVWNHETKRK